MIRYIKVRAKNIKSDPKYQREVDQRRVASMAKSIDIERIGVPVLSERQSSVLVVVDGQHRVGALVAAGLGEDEVLCEVHSGLSVAEEAALFLKLNGGRKAVGAYDKYRAELTAEAPVALEIDKIVKTAGLRITRGKGARCICAIDAVRSVHLRRHNLPTVLKVLKGWSKDDPAVFDGELLKAVGVFLCTYPDADSSTLVRSLGKLAPENVQNRICRVTSKADMVSRSDAACIVLREIYNHGLFRGQKLPPLHVVREREEEEAA